MILQAVGAHPVWHALQQHMLKSIPEYVAMATFLGIVIVANMPLPTVVKEWLYRPKLNELLAIVYKWIYDALQAFLKLLRPAGSPGDPPPQKREEYNEGKEPPK